MTRQYNGWTNYETWAVALWLDNDERTYHEIRDLVEEHKDKELFVLADVLRDYVLDLEDIYAVRSKTSLASDLLGAALEEVDWYEIAENYREDVEAITTD
jgi:hypothetical protein